MRYLVTYLVYIAVLARALGWNDETFTIPTVIWSLLAVYGLLLVSQQALTRRFAWYPRLYTLLQSVLVITMLYTSPTIDFLTLLFLPLSFQAVEFFHQWVGFAWIGAFILAMAGMILFGLEWAAGLTLVITGSAANLLMGSFAYLINRTERRRRENQRLFTDLQAAYRTLKDSAAQAEALAAAAERHRLVRELHDSLTQTLFGMNLAVQSARLSAGDDIRQAESHLVHLQALARSAAAEVQALTGPAHPHSLNQAGLAQGLYHLAEDRQAQDGLQVSVEVSGARTLPDLVEINLYRITQEALNNVVRHAGVRQALVRLSLDSPAAKLEVSDEGCGFDQAGAVRPDGFGLSGMAERAREIGWTLSISSVPGRGTHISVEEKAA